MNTNRRTILKAGAALFMPDVSAVEIPESIIGKGGMAWSDIIMCGGHVKFEDFLMYYRGEKVLSGKASDVEHRDIIKVMLRECLGERESDRGGIVKHTVLERDKQIIAQIRDNCSPELLADINKDPNFLHHLQDDEFIERLTPKKIQRNLEDIDRLTKMSQEELDQEYSKRETERIERNTRNIVNNLIGITTNATGYDLTCRASITFETVATVKDMVGSTLLPGTYKAYVQGKRSKNRIGISGGKITSICLINKEQRSYEFPKDQGKESEIIED